MPRLLENDPRTPPVTPKVLCITKGAAAKSRSGGRENRPSHSCLWTSCVEAVRRLMESDFSGAVNVGSEEMVTINRLTALITEIAGKKLGTRHIPVHWAFAGRNSDNHLIRTSLGWAFSRRPLREGLEKTYAWILEQVEQVKAQRGGGT